MPLDLSAAPLEAGPLAGPRPLAPRVARADDLSFFFLSQVSFPRAKKSAGKDG